MAMKLMMQWLLDHCIRRPSPQITQLGTLPFSTHSFFCCSVVYLFSFALSSFHSGRPLSNHLFWSFLFSHSHQHPTVKHVRGTFSHLSGSLHGVLAVKLNVSCLLIHTTVYHLAKHPLCRVLVVQQLHPVVKHCRVVQSGQISLLVPLSRRVGSFTLQLLPLWRCWWHLKHLTSSHSLCNLQ